MENIKTYIKGKCEKHSAIKDRLNEDFENENFEHFLTFSAKEYYKNEQMLVFFNNINDYIDNITKDELIKYLETTKARCIKTRIENNPVNFSTNPIFNLIRLWEFEIQSEKIKQVDIILHKSIK